jgi:transposase-like protein
MMGIYYEEDEEEADREYEEWFNNKFGSLDKIASRLGKSCGERLRKTAIEHGVDPDSIDLSGIKVY